MNHILNSEIEKENKANNKKAQGSWVPVAHTYNPTYLGG
jgi:hypothetical protein